MNLLTPLIREGFALRATLRDSSLRLDISGIADTEVQAFLGDYFMKVHAEAQGSAIAEVAVDIRELAFINSNCLKAFVTWISEVMRSPQAKRYTIRIIRDPRRRWQERSFDALHRMSMSQVIIEDPDGEAP